MQPDTILTDRFADAVAFASVVHATQLRKGTQIPYVAHLLGVASLVLDYGGTEEEAVAALLHDAVEDQGGAPMLAVIRRRFGDAVAEIVHGCTDAEVYPKPPWRERKEAYIAHVKDAPPPVRLVSACDKLHNARAILSDYRQIGESVWDRFKAGKEGTLWYYGELVTAFRQAGGSSLVDELAATVSLLQQESASPEA